MKDLAHWIVNLWDLSCVFYLFSAWVQVQETSLFCQKYLLTRDFWDYLIVIFIGHWDRFFAQGQQRNLSESSRNLAILPPRMENLLSIALEVTAKEGAASALPKSNRFLPTLMNQATCNLPWQNPNLFLTCCSFNFLFAVEHVPVNTHLQAVFYSLAARKVIPGTIKSTRWRLPSSHSKYYAAQFFSYFLANESDKCCIMCKLSYTNKSMREHEQK